MVSFKKQKQNFSVTPEIPVILVKACDCKFQATLRVTVGFKLI